MNTKHSNKPEKEVVVCGKCEKKFEGSVTLKYHKCSPHHTKYPCDYNNCGFEAANVSDIV